MHHSFCFFLLTLLVFPCSYRLTTTTFLLLVSPFFLFASLVIGFVWGEIGIQERRTVLLPLFWGLTNGFHFIIDIMAWK